MAASVRHIVKHWKKYTLCSVAYFFGARFAAKRHRSVHFSFQCSPGRDKAYARDLLTQSPAPLPATSLTANDASV